MRKKEPTFPMILSVIILISGILFIVERKITNETTTVSAMATGTLSTVDKTNASKAVVLKLMEEMNQTEEKDNNNFTYKNYLKNYLKQQNIQLSSEVSIEISEKLLQLLTLMEMEHKTDFKAMSLDSREMGLNLIKDIYKSCGLKLYADYSGQVLKITDRKGNLLYQDKEVMGQEQIRISILIVILTFLLVLFTICFFLAKKNQLYKKDVTYDVQKKEGYA